MRALVIGAEQRAAIADLIALAATRVTPLEEMMRLTADPDPTRNNDLTILIPLGYVVTYTHEVQKSGAPCRHMSVSVLAKGAEPNPHAVAMLMDEFGFVNPLGVAATYVERLSDGRGAVNVIEPLSGDMSQLRKPS